VKLSEAKVRHFGLCAFSHEARRLKSRRVVRRQARDGRSLLRIGSISKVLATELLAGMAAAGNCG